MARIKHPNPQDGTFTDILGGVVFRDGFAQVDLTDDPNLLDAYLMHGYEVELEAVALESLTVAELRDIAEVENIDLPAKASKAAIIDRIDSAPGIRTLTAVGED